MTTSKHQRMLNRIMWRSRFKMLLQVGGILLVLLGAIFVIGKHTHGPKATIFNSVVSSGIFDRPAVILIGIGAIVIAASLLIREKLYEGP